MLTAELHYLFAPVYAPRISLSGAIIKIVDRPSKAKATQLTFY
jgi:hypothetical protein